MHALSRLGCGGFATLDEARRSLRSRDKGGRPGAPRPTLVIGALGTMDYSINPLRQRAEPRQEAWHGGTIHCESDGFLRAGVDPGQALFGHRGEQDDLLQSAAQDLRVALEAAVLLHQGGGSGRARGHGEGLRIRQGPVRDVHAGGAEGDGGSRHAHGRDHRIRAARSRSTRSTSTRRTTSLPTRAAPSLMRSSRARCANRSAARSAGGRRAASSTS